MYRGFFLFSDFHSILYLKESKRLGDKPFFYSNFHWSLLLTENYENGFVISFNSELKVHHSTFKK